MRLGSPEFSSAIPGYEQPVLRTGACLRDIINLYAAP
jgi:hypothetical protein